MTKGRSDKCKVTVVLTRDEKSKLKRRAQSEGLSVAALIRRLALGFVALALIACGGETFSSPGPVGSAGMPSGSGGMGSGGSGGMPGAAGMGGGYDGPAWVECATGELVARGLDRAWGDYEFLVMAEYRGSDWSLTALTPRVNGEFIDGTHADESVVNSGTTQLLTFRVSNVAAPVTLAPRDTISVGIGWSPEGGGEIPDAEPMRCMVLLDGFEVAAYP